MNRKDWGELLLELAKIGWVREGDVLRAPGGSMWFLVETPWHEDLQTLCERMLGRQQRIEATADMYENPCDHRGSSSDVAGLISVLHAMLAKATPAERR